MFSRGGNRGSMPRGTRINLTSRVNSPRDSKTSKTKQQRPIRQYDEKMSLFEKAEHIMDHDEPTILEYLNWKQPDSFDPRVELSTETIQDFMTLAKESNQETAYLETLLDGLENVQQSEKKLKLASDFDQWRIDSLTSDSNESTHISSTPSRIDVFLVVAWKRSALQIVPTDTFEQLERKERALEKVTGIAISRRLGLPSRYASRFHLLWAPNGIAQLVVKVINGMGPPTRDVSLSDSVISFLGMNPFDLTGPDANKKYQVEYLTPQNGWKLIEGTEPSKRRSFFDRCSAYTLEKIISTYPDFIEKYTVRQSITALEEFERFRVEVTKALAGYLTIATYRPVVNKLVGWEACIWPGSTNPSHYLFYMFYNDKMPSDITVDTNKFQWKCTELLRDILTELNNKTIPMGMPLYTDWVNVVPSFNTLLVKALENRIVAELERVFGTLSESKLDKLLEHYVGQAYFTPFDTTSNPYTDKGTGLNVIRVLYKHDTFKDGDAFWIHPKPIPTVDEIMDNRLYIIYWDNYISHSNAYYKTMKRRGAWSDDLCDKVREKDKSEFRTWITEHKASQTTFINDMRKRLIELLTCLFFNVFDCVPMGRAAYLTTPDPKIYKDPDWLSKDHYPEYSSSSRTSTIEGRINPLAIYMALFNKRSQKIGNTDNFTILTDIGITDNSNNPLPIWLTFDSEAFFIHLGKTGSKIIPRKYRSYFS